MSMGEQKKVTAATLGWLLLAVAGGIAWFLVSQGGQEPRGWRALLSNFLFFSSLAGGLAAWPAVARGCNGKWQQGLERLAAAGTGFAIPSLLAVGLLWWGSSVWSPWYGRIHHQGAWLDNSFVFARTCLELVVFWGLVLIYLRQRRQGRAPVTGGFLILVYCLVYSLIGMDFVMALDPHWFSTLAGAYFFMSGLYLGISGWAFIAVWRPEANPEQLKDLGRLMVAFSLMTTYMMFAHLLLIWYENLPHEVRFIVPRMNFEPGKGVGYLLLATLYFGPLVLLLIEKSKANRPWLGAVSLLVLVAGWLERWWLVAPTFNPAALPGAEEFAAAALFAGVFGFCFQQALVRMPASFMSGER
ncbi:hypothetical protein [Geomesophilobacter sediminis]|uniref:Uncharacterized protein n=1 Tax=Geomesophilobacter sediminis TaxID=2798584 RepID=A0A8J7JEK2_9BACT|nr:hypothetical protein [Geomesophilobacter sediminis]MBJ6726098.1 hypothetical protein [Geomesophilobacter sediminis]